MELAKQMIMPNFNQSLEMVQNRRLASRYKQEEKVKSPKNFFMPNKPNHLLSHDDVQQYSLMVNKKDV